MQVGHCDHFICLPYSSCDPCSKDWISNLSAYWVEPWCTYPRNETLVGVETFEGENFHKFRGFVAIHKVFSVKFGGAALFGSTNEQSAKVFSMKYIFHQFAKVSSAKVSHYTVFYTHRGESERGGGGHDLPFLEEL